MVDKYLWWQQGIIYQIYPRSFQDSNGDGIGDLPGIVSRLDYLVWLGVDAIWLSPIFPSPMVDFGYDVSDYTAIHPIFGTMADFDALVDAAHARNLKVLLDYVPNHTSDQHPWFVESRSSRDNPKRDWYIWKDPAPDGGPPTNWVGNFGGSAWTFDTGTGQYYYHGYLPEQPDLNWRNREVREAMYNVLRFWLDRGVDGFRVDVLWKLIKDDQFRDNPPNPDYVPSLGPYKALLPLYTSDLPEGYKIVTEMRRVLDEYDERMMVGELYLPIERVVTYYGENLTGAHLPFNFQLIRLPWSASVIKRAVDNYETLIPPGGWPNWVLGNHDRHRVASRVGHAQARVAAMMLLTLRGTPTLYYGDEIGMSDVPIPPELVQDPWERNVPGLGLGRDPVRTPMQWDRSPNAGFTTGASPWLPVADDYILVNVEAERDDPSSMLSLNRRLIALRRSEPALSVGTYVPIESEGDVFAYMREYDNTRFVVVLNLSPQKQLFPFHMRRGRIVLGTHLDRENEEAGEVLDLRDSEGIIVKVMGDE